MCHLCPHRYQTNRDGYITNKCNLDLASLIHRSKYLSEALPNNRVIPPTDECFLEANEQHLCPYYK